jgi:hypothetical protein
MSNRTKIRKSRGWVSAETLASRVRVEAVAQAAERLIIELGKLNSAQRRSILSDLAVMAEQHPDSDQPWTRAVRALVAAIEGNAA